MLSKITKYMILPKEMTEFEVNYLKRLNRLALFFFYVHIPIFMGIAWLAGTGPLFALALSSVAVIGPTVAYWFLKNQRTISMVHGFTAMIMGGILVHFGQGPMQIEMHFYFFALLAMLCMFANPMVNIVAALTAAVHHLVIWWYLPNSVFNYDASFEVVLVHAAFVVLETVAACYISREFFDNVIGLDKIVQARTSQLAAAQRDMSLILDNIDQGFITVNLDGVMCGKTSTIVHEWFGKEEDKMTFSDYIRHIDQGAADWFELGLESVKDGFLPVDVAFEQLPRLLKFDSKTMKLEYKAVTNDAEEVEKVIIVISDITDLIQKEISEALQKQMLSVFEHIMRDKIGFIEFLTESDQQMNTIVNKQYEDLTHLKRLIHTIKGNSSIFGLTGIADVCHELENQIVSEETLPNDEEIQVLSEAWKEMRQRLDELLGQSRRRMDNVIKIDDVEYRAILHAVLTGENPEKTAEMIRSWKLEPIQNRFGTLKQQAERLAKRMGKTDITINILPSNIRITKEYWAPFWSNFVHVIRNAVDHGIETPEERRQAGKKAGGTLELKSYVEWNQFVISVSDDGKGIDWQSVAEKAKSLNLPHSTHDDLVKALFSEGVSTKDVATDISGRGVGMGAVLQACENLGGKIDIFTKEKQGTQFLFKFPMTENVYQVVDNSKLKIAA